MSDTNWRGLKDYFDNYKEPEEHDSDLSRPVGDFYIVGGRLGRYNGPVGDVTVPEGITEIGDGVFQNRDGVTGITIPKSVIRICPRSP